MTYHWGKSKPSLKSGPSSVFNFSETKAMKLTAKNFVEMLVDLEPVGEGTKEEEEYRQTEQQQRRHDTGGIPNFTSLSRHQTMRGQARKQPRENTMISQTETDGNKREELHTSLALSSRG